jgi:hypothetical protein
MQPHIDEAWRHNMTLPVSKFELRSLNPFPVTFRYDDTEIGAGMPGDQVERLVTKVREWAEKQVENTSYLDRLEEEHST